MVKEVLVAKKGYEEEFDFINKKIANVEADKDIELAKAKEEVEAKFSEKLETYKSFLTDVSEVVEEEVEDEVQEEVADVEA